MPLQLTPTSLARTWSVAPKHPEVAVDTETSGLFPDEGARVATVSVAWIDEDGWWVERLGWGQTVWPGGVVTVRDEPVFADGPVRHRTVVSMAWPFDQGVEGTGKPEDHGRMPLFPDTENQPREEWVALLDWLSELRTGSLVMHHAKFDVAMLKVGCRRWPGLGVDLLHSVGWDTQNGCSLIYTPHVLIPGKYGELVPTTSLKPTSAWLWGDGETGEQDAVKRYLKAQKLPAGRWDLMPWSVIGTYADDDARKTIRLRVRQAYDLLHRPLGLTGEGRVLSPRGALERRLTTTRMLARVERRGVPFDIAGALEVAGRLDEVADELRGRLPFQPATTPRAKKYWFEERGLVPYERTDSGEPSLTAEVVRRMVADGVPHAQTWADLVKVETANSRWYRGWASMAGSDGRMRPSFRQNGTVSGRFSVERIQLQAIPHDYRLSEFEVLEGLPTPRALISRGIPEGWALWELDLANAEARVAALYAGCDPMLEAFASGADIHGLTAKALFTTDETDPRWSELRTQAKRGNFSLIFGVGPETFQDSLAKEGSYMSLPAVQDLIRDWNRLYPQYRRAIEVHEERVLARQRKYGYGWLGTVNGERRWFTEKEDPHKAFNQRVQANLAQLGIDWWLAAEAHVAEMLSARVVDGVDLQTGAYVGGVGAVLMVHDSLDLLVPDDEFGRALVQDAQDIGAAIWADRFPGVGGRVDATPW